MLQQVQQQNVWIKVKNIKSRKCQKLKTLKDKNNIQSAVECQNQHEKEEQLNSLKEFCLNEPI